MTALAQTSAWARVASSIRPYTLVAGFAVLLLGLPQNNVIAGTGASITPARLLAGGCLLWWLAGRLSGHLSVGRRLDIVRVTLLGLLLVLGVAHGLALAYGIPEAVLKDSDRSIMLLVLVVGVTMLVCDGVRGIGPLRTIFAALVIGATLSSFTAMVHFGTHADLRALTALPGLQVQDLGFVYTDRGGLERTFGLANHPVELAGISAMVLPLALHLERFAAHPVFWRFCAAVLVAGPLVSISRTGFLGVALLGLALLPRSGWHRWAGGALFAGLVAVFVSLFDPRLTRVVSTTVSTASSDLSVMSRLNDYAYVAEQVSLHPISGQGFGTYRVPPQPYLDNQYLFTAVESGIPGAVALFTAVLVPMLLMFTIWQRGKRLAQPGTRLVRLNNEMCDAAWSIGVALLICLACLATFDALSFPQFLGVIFLLIGLAAALSNTVDLRIRPTGRRQAHV